MKRITIDNSYGIESLAESIVLQAVKDYIRAYRKVLRDPSDAKAVSVIAKNIAAMSSSITISQVHRLPSSIRLDHTPSKQIRH